MKSKIKTNQKIRNLLSSILYPEEDLTRQFTTADFHDRSKEIVKDTAQGQQNTGILNRLKDYWLTGMVILVLTLAVASFILKDIERHKSIKLEHALLEIKKTKDGIQNELTEFKQEARERATRDAFKLARDRSLLLRTKDHILELLFGLKQERAKRLQLKEENNDIKNLLLSTMKAKGDLEKRLMEQDARRRRTDIESISVRTGPIVNSNVSIVNAIDNFVVVDLGREDRLTPGTILAVYRDNMFIARLLVVLTDDRVSIATIVPAWRDIGIIEEGDIVRSL